MRLTQWAKKHGVVYKTAWNQFKAGQIPDAYQLPSGTIIIPEAETVNPKTLEDYTVCYARVSSSQNKDNLDSQAARLVAYANARGYGVSEVIKEIGSGLNDSRPKLLKLLASRKPTRIVVEHKDRLTRFGFHYIELLCTSFGCEIEIINAVDTDTADIMQDFVSLVTSFCARLYGLRRSRRNTEKLIDSLQTGK